MFGIDNLTLAILILLVGCLGIVLALFKGVAVLRRDVNEHERIVSKQKQQIKKLKSQLIHGSIEGDMTRIAFHPEEPTRMISMDEPLVLNEEDDAEPSGCMVHTHHQEMIHAELAREAFLRQREMAYRQHLLHQHLLAEDQERSRLPIEEEVEPILLNQPVEESVTEEPVKVAEEAVKVVEEPVKITEEPVEVTEVKVAEEPVIVAEEPIKVAEDPDVKREGSEESVKVAEVAEEPIKVAEDPDVKREESEEPVKVTEEAIKVAEEPVKVAEDSVKVIEEEAIKVAEEPVKVAEEPVKVAEEPVKVIEEPVKVAESIFGTWTLPVVKDDDSSEEVEITFTDDEPKVEVEPLKNSPQVKKSRSSAKETEMTEMTEMKEAVKPKRKYERKPKVDTLDNVKKLNFKSISSEN